MLNAAKADKKLAEDTLAKDASLKTKYEKEQKDAEVAAQKELKLQRVAQLNNLAGYLTKAKSKYQDLKDELDLQEMIDKTLTAGSTEKAKNADELRNLRDRLADAKLAKENVEKDYNRQKSDNAKAKKVEDEATARASEETGLKTAKDAMLVAEKKITDGNNRLKQLNEALSRTKDSTIIAKIQGNINTINQQMTTFKADVKTKAEAYNGLAKAEIEFKEKKRKEQEAV